MVLNDLLLFEHLKKKHEKKIKFDFCETHKEPHWFY